MLDWSPGVIDADIDADLPSCTELPLLRPNWHFVLRGNH